MCPCVQEKTRQEGTLQTLDKIPHGPCVTVWILLRVYENKGHNLWVLAVVAQ